MSGSGKNLALCFVLIFALVGVCSARVRGVCANCHTMHNYQKGAVVAEAGPYPGLTKNDCVGCHTGSNGDGSGVPYVMSYQEPVYEFNGAKTTLAGGSFYWVANQADPTLGHNVRGITSPEYRTPPGFSTSYNAHGDLGADWGSNPLSCAGRYGCHGRHDADNDFEAVLGAHHADDSVIDGSTVGKSYRFLLGIKGTEDGDWEYTTSASDHNGYYASDYLYTGTMDPASINYLCAECHGLFHMQTGVDDSLQGSPWLRHPTDFDMNHVSSKEYGSYPDPSLIGFSFSVGDYFPDVPLGNTQGAVKSKVLQTSGDAIVLCISCHRAHGSKYKYMLRWDYYGWPLKGGINGCIVCHSAKD